MEVGDFLRVDEDRHFFAPGGDENFAVVDVDFGRKGIFIFGDQFDFAKFFGVVFFAFNGQVVIRTDGADMDVFFAAAGVVFGEKVGEGCVHILNVGVGADWFFRFQCVFVSFAHAFFSFKKLNLRFGGGGALDGLDGGENFGELLFFFFDFADVFVFFALQIVDQVLGVGDLKVDRRALVDFGGEAFFDQAVEDVVDRGAVNSRIFGDIGGCFGAEAEGAEVDCGLLLG